MTGQLAGYTIGVTADRRSDEQISLLTGRGAVCRHGPTIRTHPLRPEGAIRSATERFLANPPDVVVATTAIGLRGWLEAADALLLGAELRSTLTQCRLFVRGPKTHGAAITADLEVKWAGVHATTAEVLDRLRTELEPGQRVAVQVDGASQQPFVDAIEALGAEALAISIYRWSLPDDTNPAETLIRAVADHKVDAITFTARPAAENFLELAAGLGLLDRVRTAMNGPVKTFCVGPVCAKGVVDLGIAAPFQPERFRLGAMVACITKTLQSQNAEVLIGGRTVRLQGRQVTVDGGDPKMLAGRERQVLDVLLQRPGLVHSKGSLLRHVWGNGESDTHVVEVTVGRLRRRLGPAGVGIETVMRRGYRASET